MAKITTITNPLTGQPAQVDQLDHTAQEIDDGIGFESTDYAGCYYRMVSGVVEWVNPPMVVGTEYRTTERYLGKPVYVKLVNFGALPNATTKKVEYGNSGCSPIFGYGISFGTTFPTVSYGGALADSLNSGRVISLWLNGNELSISCGGDRSKINAYVFVKYYKTTD